ncbi:MAG TPA: TetR family transcriptional regulator [Fibrobacteria bacterium]|nr:TetR family transcriptional regulator [Fibrobacteria bacterium]
MSGIHRKSRSVRGSTSEPAEPAEDTRVRILEATNKLVGTSGFDGTSIRDIARESSTNPALVYYYFGSKEGLFTALADHNAGRVRAILDQAARMDGTVRDRVRHFLQTWMEALFEPIQPIAPWFRKALQDQGMVGEILRERVASNIAILAGILDAGVERGEINRLRVPSLTLATGLMVSIAGLAMEILLPHRTMGLDLATKESKAAFIEGMLDAWFAGLERKGAADPDVTENDASRAGPRAPAGEPAGPPRRRRSR